MTTSKPAPKPAPAKKTLATVIGTAVGAALIYVAVPREESGRQVVAVVNLDNTVTVRNVKGKLYLKTYLDIVGVPTACDGVTGKDIKLGQVRTEEQCNALLDRELIAHAAPIVSCVPGVYGRPYQVGAAVGLSYNVGPGGFCKSSIAQLWNRGQWDVGCDRFPLYNKAGGHVLRNLVLRRERERQTCLTGLRPGLTPANLQARIKAVQ